MTLEAKFSEQRLPPYTYHHEIYNYDSAGIIKIPKMVTYSQFHEYYINEITTRLIKTKFKDKANIELTGSLNLLKGQIQEHVEYFSDALRTIEQLLISHLKAYEYDFGSVETEPVGIEDKDILSSLNDPATYLEHILKLYQNYQCGSPFVDEISDKRTARELLVDPELGELIYQKYDALYALIESTAIFSVKYLVLQQIRFQIAIDDTMLYSSMLKKRKDQATPI